VNSDSVSDHRPRAILSAPGSRGDVNPVVAIGRALHARGYECFVSVAEPYADVVRAAGLHANVVIDSESFHRVASQSEFWKPLTGGRRVLAELAEKFFHPHLQFLDDHYIPGCTVLVAHPLDFASRVFRETRPECRLSSIHLAPAMLRHDVSPPRMLPDRIRYRGVLRPGWRRLNRLTYWLGDHCFLDRVLGRSINQARHQRGGLPTQRRLLNEWCRSPDQLLGLYPSWFAPEIAERYASGNARAAGLQCIGFPLDDAAEPHSSDELPPDRPLLVTTGTAHPGDTKFVQRVAELCQPAGINVVWCCPSNPGGVWRDNIRSVGYVPLGQWLPLCRGIIHHGGIGTTSRAIAAGVPQMIRPLAFDQFDNAERVQRFGFGQWLRRDRDLPQVLDILVRSPHFEPPQRDPESTTAERAASLIAGL
jgi:rhamnosyltransferase subunit B